MHVYWGNTQRPRRFDIWLQWRIYCTLMWSNQIINLWDPFLPTTEKENMWPSVWYATIFFLSNLEELLISCSLAFAVNSSKNWWTCDILWTIGTAFKECYRIFWGQFDIEIHLSIAFFFSCFDFLLLILFALSC